MRTQDSLYCEELGKDMQQMISAVVPPGTLPGKAGVSVLLPAKLDAQRISDRLHIAVSLQTSLTQELKRLRQRLQSRNQREGELSEEEKGGSS